MQRGLGEVEKKRCPRHSDVTTLTMRVKTAQIQKVEACDARQHACVVQGAPFSALEIRSTTALVLQSQY